MPDPFQDEVYTQPPNYTGGSFTVSEQFDTVAAARSYVTAFIGGEYDPFLAKAWQKITISQNRNPNGTFAPGFKVAADCNRPGPGETS